MELKNVKLSDDLKIWRIRGLFYSIYDQIRDSLFPMKWYAVIWVDVITSKLHITTIYVPQSAYCVSYAVKLAWYELTHEIEYIIMQQKCTNEWFWTHLRCIYFEETYVSKCMIRKRNRLFIIHYADISNPVFITYIKFSE